METTDTVNNKNLKSAISLDYDINWNGPVSFKAISVNNLNTNDLISNINFNHWMANSFRLWSQQPQIVTGNWALKNAAIDSISSTTGLNGNDVATYASKIEFANHNLYQNYKETCNRVHDLVNESQKNVVFLSHFEIAFKLPHAARVVSIYLFEVGRQDYLITNAGCWTSLYQWNHQTQLYDHLTDKYTGVVNEWIHLLDLRNTLHFVSIGEQPTTKTGCSMSGANIWEYQSEKRTIVDVAAFGSAETFRSVQIKPNSRTHFYAVRVEDNRVIEYNLNGAPVTEWIVDEVQRREPAWNFVPTSANLGLAISNGESLSLLTNDEKTASPGTHTNQDKEETQETIANLRKAFNEYNAAKMSIFSDLTPSHDPEQLEKVRERIRKLDESMVPLTHELIELLENGLHATAAAATMNHTDPDVNVGTGLDLGIGGRVKDLIINELDVVTSFVTGEKTESSEEDDDSEEEELFMAKQGEENGGDKFGDLIEKLTPTADALFDKLINEIRSKKIKENERQNVHDYAEVGSASNSSKRPDNAVLGDKFGDLIEKLTPVADNVFGQLMSFIRRDKSTETNTQSDYDLGSERNAGQPSAEDRLADELSSYLKLEVQLALQRVLATNDPSVGGKFGDAIDDLTPVADEAFNKLIDKIQAKKRRRPILTDDLSRSVQIHGMSIFDKNQKQNASNNGPNVGDKFGDLMDKLTPTADALFDKLIEKIRSNEMKQNNRPQTVYDYVYEPPQNVYAVGSAPKTSQRLDDAMLGDKFGDLMEKLTPIADNVFEHLMKFIRKKKTENSNPHGEYDVESVGNVTESSTEDQLVGDLFSYLQGKIQFELMRARDAKGPNVGDKFGEAKEDLMPVADVVFYKLVDKIRAKKRSQRPQSAGIFAQSVQTNAKVTMDAIAQRLQNQPKHYDPFEPKYLSTGLLFGNNGDLQVKGAHKTGKNVFEIEEAIREAVKVFRDDEMSNGLHTNGKHIAEPLLGSALNDSEAAEIYPRTLHKYIKIAKKIFTGGKAFFDGIKGLTDDNDETNEDYAAPESHYNPHQPHHNDAESYYPSSTSGPDDYQHGFNGPSESHGPIHHNSNITPQSHHESKPDFEYQHPLGPDSNIRPESHRPHQPDFDTSPGSSDQQHYDFNAPAEPHQPHQQNFYTPQEPLRPLQPNFDSLPASHRPHYNNPDFPHESNVPQSLIDNHLPSLHDFDIPTEDIRAKTLHKIIANTDLPGARLLPKQYVDRNIHGEQFLGLTKSETNLQSPHKENDPILELDQTDAGANESDLVLGADPIVYAGQSDQWVSAYRKCQQVLLRIHKNGGLLIKRMHETRDREPMATSIRENTANRSNAQNEANSFTAINHLGSPDDESELHLLVSDAKDFHDDTGDLLNQLQIIHDKYSETMTNDDHETRFRNDVHSVFMRMEQVVAKYDEKSIAGFQKHHDALHRLQKREKTHVKRMSTLSVSMPNLHLFAGSNNQIIAVTVGSERKPLIIASSQRENVIKGDHDTIQVTYFVCTQFFIMQYEPTVTDGREYFHYRFTKTSSTANYIKRYRATNQPI